MSEQELLWSSQNPSQYPSGMSDRDLQELEIGSDGKDKDCSICLDKFSEVSQIRVLPCKHQFDEECLFPWLKIQASCPLCRHQLKNQPFGKLIQSF